MISFTPIWSMLQKPVVSGRRCLGWQPLFTDDPQVLRWQTSTWELWDYWSNAVPTVRNWLSTFIRKSHVHLSLAHVSSVCYLSPSRENLCSISHWNWLLSLSPGTGWICGAHDSRISSANVSSSPRSPHPSLLSVPEILGNQLYFQSLGFLVITGHRAPRKQVASGELKKGKMKQDPHSPQGDGSQPNFCQKSSQPSPPWDTYCSGFMFGRASLSDQRISQLSRLPWKKFDRKHF